MIRVPDGVRLEPAPGVVVKSVPQRAVNHPRPLGLIVHGLIVHARSRRPERGRPGHPDLGA